MGQRDHTTYGPVKSSLSRAYEVRGKVMFSVCLPVYGVAGYPDQEVSLPPPNSFQQMC